ncbi:DUF3291 domain-containing protein [Pelagibius litoralis]|uniref:DUF3291 domain-containing protein n=1 Tax=Pelagibius litoralis TaxID=374515 RepID=A0A967F353_9PROT|nr:DUF3291 domain-containing protein [Pelagibius litoralis]NIA72143.1 DUF3291 domain-containing protein [Pelagibius litoralis]
MTEFHLAQVNVGRLRAPIEDPTIAGFVRRLDDINALAERSRGFVWRLQSESGNATDILTSPDPRFIVNMSVWQDLESLFAYVYKTDHTKVMARRRQWFEKPPGAFMALWWVPAGSLPSVEDGLQRVALLEAEGPTAKAFTFKTAFDVHGRPMDRSALVRTAEPCF